MTSRGVVAAGAGQHRHRGRPRPRRRARRRGGVSRASSVGLSPVVPQGTRKCIPASTWRRARRVIAGSSRAPSLVNGVTSAVPQPVKGVRVAMSQISRTSPHRKPPAAAAHPARGDEGAMRERGTIADGVGQGDGLGRPVEADRVDAGHEADPRRGDVDRTRKAAPLERALEQQRGARRRVLLGRVVRSRGRTRRRGPAARTASPRRSVSASISVAPTEKLAVTHRADAGARRSGAARRRRAPASRWCRRRGCSRGAHSAGRLATKASGALASMATSTSRQRARSARSPALVSSMVPAMVAPACGAAAAIS